MSKDESRGTRRTGGGSRRRSARYPGATLAQVLDFIREIDTRRCDGKTAATIAAAMGHRSIRTHTFSARLSAARQFGLIWMRRGHYGLTERARGLLHPQAGDDKAALRRQAFLAPEMYAELAMSLAGKVLPDVEALAGRLEREHGVAPGARDRAATVFLASAQEAGLVHRDGVLRLDEEQRPAVRKNADSLPSHQSDGARIHVALPLQGIDSGKYVEVRAPASMSRASFDRLARALEALIEVTGPPDALD